MELNETLTLYRCVVILIQTVNLYYDLCHVNHFQTYCKLLILLPIYKRDAILLLEEGIGPEHDTSESLTSPPVSTHLAGGGELWPQALRRRLPCQRDLGGGDGVP